VVEFGDMKNCLRNFWTDIKNSIYGRDYKGDFASRTFGQGVSFIAKLTFIEVLIIVLVGSALFIPVAKMVLDRENVYSFLDTYIPTGAEVNVKDGKVTTPDGKPVVIPFPEDSEVKDVENILIVDPSVTENELMKYEEYNTMVLVTSDKIVSIEEDDSVKVSSLSEVPDYKINRDTFVSLYEKFRPYIFVMIPMFLIVGGLAIFVFGVIFTLIINIFVALITWLISKVKKVDLTYKQSYVVSLFAMTVSAIVSVISIALGHTLNFLWILAVIAIAVSVNLNKKEEL
jgi:hypothetical protein